MNKIIQSISKYQNIILTIAGTELIISTLLLHHNEHKSIINQGSSLENTSSMQFLTLSFYLLLFIMTVSVSYLDKLFKTKEKIIFSEIKDLALLLPLPFFIGGYIGITLILKIQTTLPLTAGFICVHLLILNIAFLSIIISKFNSEIINNKKEDL